MTDLSEFNEEDITRWGEDENPEDHMGEFVEDEFGEEDDDADSV